MQKRKLILLIAFFVYTISAIFNNGFYYFDEHYQLVEFAELKSGNNKPSDLAWEYDDEVRSTVQPMIVFVFFSAMRVVGLNDHYFLMIALRLFTAFLALIIVTAFIEKTNFLLREDLKLPYRLVSYFLWFLPFVNVRFSSESYSGLAFLLTIALFYSSSRHKFLLIGALFGLSFLFRFQTAFMALGFFIWLVFIEKLDIRNLMKVVLGTLIMVAIGIAIDWWFYENLTVTFVNYFLANVVDGVASNYGTSPWYYYFIKVTEVALTPLGVVIWISLFVQLVSNKKGVLCWIVVPFLLAHILTPHKEVRFLFPLVNLIPLLILLTIQYLTDRYNFKIARKNYIAIIIVLIVGNGIILLTNMFSPADGQGRMNITREIHQHFKYKNVILLTARHDNPYRPISVNQNFYLDKNVSFQEINAYTPLLQDTNTVNLLAIRADRLTLKKGLSDHFKLQKIAGGVADWIIQLKEFVGYPNRSLLLFEIRPLKTATSK